MNTNGPANARVVIDNTIADMRKVVDFVDRFGAANHIPQPVINDLNLCLDELLNNTISYGYNDPGPHRIVVRLSLADDRVLAEIQDDAKPFDPRGAGSVPPEGSLQSRKLGGLGIRFIKTLADEIGYMREEPYNIVRVVKKLRQDASNGNR